MKKRWLTVLMLAAALLMFLPSAAQAGPRAVGLSPAELTMAVGEKKTVQMIVGLGAMDPKGWSSSNKKVATVTKKGVVTAKKAGSAKIICKTPFGYNLTCKVTVKKPLELSGYLNKKYTKLLKKVPEAVKSPSDPLEIGNLYLFPDDTLFFRHDTRTGKISVLQNSYDKSLTLFGVSLGMKGSKAKKALMAKGWSSPKITRLPDSRASCVFRKGGQVLTVSTRNSKVEWFQWSR